MKVDNNYINSNYNNLNNVNRGRSEAKSNSNYEKVKLFKDYESIKKKDYEDMTKELEYAVEKANNDFKVYDKKFEISVHEKTKRIAVKVLDRETNEVLREIPPEKILDLIAEIWEVTGIAIDKKV